MEAHNTCCWSPSKTVENFIAVRDRDDQVKIEGVTDEDVPDLI